MVRSARGRRSTEDARAFETVALVNEILLQRPVDITRLRKLTAIRGLVTDGLRSRVWPLLLGVEGPGPPGEAAAYAELAASTHKDSHVVECDMARSLWSFTEGWAEGERAEKRAALRRVLDATLAGNAGGLFYYQGLHDIAAVLLFVCGEPHAHRLLRALAACHLRDCTRPDLAAATETLRLLYPILQQCDPELHAHITSLHEPALEVPYFALSWYMTWFAHDVPSLPQIARLFDLFLSSHPLMPLYVAAVAIKSQRQRIFECGGDGVLVYAALKKMRFLQPGQPSADELAQQAAALYQAVPPAHLARQRGIHLEHSAAIHAYLSGGRWHVPAEPRAVQRPFGTHAVEQLQAIFMPSEGPTAQRRTAALAAVLTSLTGLAAMGVVLLNQMRDAPWGR